METAKDKKYEKRGWYIAIGVHTILAILFFFLLAWQAPDPPIPEYGILVNFGTDNAGSGNVQPKRTPQPEKVIEKKEETPTPPTESTETVQEQIQEETVEDIPDTEQEVKSVVQEEPSPVVQKEEQKSTPKKVEAKDPPKEAPKKVEEKPKHLFPTSNNQGKNNPSNDNQGNQPNAVGDQGQKQGTVDAKSLYGSQGGGGGSSLDLAGWRWDSPPNPADNSNEGGRIIFEIKVDEQGEIISVRTLQKTVSPAVERIYREEVESLTFSKTADNTRSASVSTGRITFIIKAN